MVAELSQLRTAFPPDGTPLAPATGSPLDIALTTNGHLLESLAAPLAAAGLNRITVSMDAVDPETFARITRVPRSFDRVLAGVRAAQAAGLGPVKVNCVLLRGFNDAQIEAFAEFSRREGVIVRFIEFMPLEEDRTWKPETVVPMDEILARLNAWRPSCSVPAGLVELPPTPPARPPTATPSATASAKSASSPRSRGPSAATAAAFASPPTAPSAPASSRSPTTTSTVRSARRHRRGTRRLYPPRRPPKRPATTSASPASRNLRATWST